MLRRSWLRKKFETSRANHKPRSGSRRQKIDTISVGTGATKSQIVRTPFRVFYDCVGKPDWIVFSQFESIYGTAKIFK